MTASVRSGMISDTAPTNVVLPAPKPPETTIFVERVGRPSEPLKATEHPPQECGITFVPAGAEVSSTSTSPNSTMSAMITRATPSGVSQADGDLRDRHRTLAQLDHAWRAPAREDRRPTGRARLRVVTTRASMVEGRGSDGSDRRCAHTAGPVDGGGAPSSSGGVIVHLRHQFGDMPPRPACRRSGERCSPTRSTSRVIS